MKLSSLHRRRSRLELSMTSMIDVVFLLLIFFLVTTTFIRPERQVQSTISPERISPAQNKSLLEPAVVSIKLASNGQPFFRLGAVESSRIERISEILGAFENKSEGAVVRVRDDVPFGAAAKAIAACRAAGFVTVSYLPDR